MSQAEVHITNTSQTEVEITVEKFWVIYFYTCTCMGVHVCAQRKKKRKRKNMLQQKLVLRRDVGNHHLHCNSHVRSASGSTNEVPKSDINRS